MSATVVNIISYFYPIGNTPAVSLIQDLPPDIKADILLLGCGDVRNILFTAFCNAGTLPRQLDITCCDVEPAIIARNILLFTLLVDDGFGKDTHLHWQIYYHMFLDKKALKLLETAAQSLLDLSNDMETWDSGPYANLIKFCDQGTRVMVRRVWKSYLISQLSKEERSKFNANYEASVKKSLLLKEQRVGQGGVMTGLRSASPTSFQALQDLTQLHTHFWEYGSTDANPTKLPQKKIPNPMFASSATESLTIHYGIDPHLGFPLATAYAPIVPPATNQSAPYKVTKAARNHFEAWSKSFRSQASKILVLRFFIGDAINFCHSLQHHKPNGTGPSNWYRTRYLMEPLLLEGAGMGPIRFDIIDTSNLADHVGPLNIIVAASPLLKENIMATLYTELLVAQDKDREALRARMLCGNFPTMSLLLGLVPMEYWTNATTSSSVEENMMNTMLKEDDDTAKGQMFSRMGWKRLMPSITTSRRVSFNASDLAALLHRVYRNMFEHENMGSLLSKMTIASMTNTATRCYNRASLVALLKLIKSNVVVNWSAFIQDLVSRIEKDVMIMVGMNQIQELYVQLHIQQVHTMEPMSQPVLSQTFMDGVGSWPKKPPVVCITLLVPRDSLGVFTSLPHSELGTPTLQATLQMKGGIAGGAFNTFLELQLGFGSIQVVGTPTDPDFKVTVNGDEKAWLGNSPLFVSFYVPTSFVVVDPECCFVSLAVQSSPMSTFTFMATLGMEMNVFQAGLKDTNRVFITQYAPSQPGYRMFGPAQSSFLPGALTKNTPTESMIESISATLDVEKSSISTFTGRLDLLPGSLKQSLLKGAPVALKQRSPFILTVNIGHAEHHDFVFPTPVMESKSQLRIARKSSYIEIIVPMADHVVGTGFPRFMFPIVLTTSGPVISNMSYLHIDCLPILDTGKTKELAWLIPHASHQMSARERALRGGPGVPEVAINANLRVNYKDSIFSILMRFSGLQGTRSSAFVLDKPDDGGGHIIILVSTLRLDLANHTVVLDCAVIPLINSSMTGLDPFLKATIHMGMPVIRIQVDGEELRLWRELFPAMVERCRQWKHKPTCEYSVHATIPLSLADGEQFLCSCGIGVFPDKFITKVPRWDVAQRFATRAAISPCFSVSYVEPSYQGTPGLGLAELMERCRFCGKKKTTAGRALLLCSKCKIAKYCSKECQRADWKDHKRICKTW